MIPNNNCLIHLNFPSLVQSARPHEIPDILQFFPTPHPYYSACNENYNRAHENSTRRKVSKKRIFMPSGDKKTRREVAGIRLWSDFVRKSRCSIVCQASHYILEYLKVVVEDKTRRSGTYVQEYSFSNLVLKVANKLLLIQKLKAILDMSNINQYNTS